MTRIILNGCNGAMGKNITEYCAKTEDVQIVAGVDINTIVNSDYPVYSTPFDVKEKADAVIDFSHPSAFNNTLEYCKNTSTPLVMCTTGLSEEQKQAIDDASSIIPVFHSANMSIGINLISDLVKRAAQKLGLDYNIEIVEAHHNKKLDAPSGTAIMLADAVKAGLSESVNLEYDRHSKREKRPRNEIGMHSIRGGTIVGEHEVMFAGDDEIITVSHSARSKMVFAIGSVNAAKYIANKKPGKYNMTDLISD